ncbi:hypothetical protein DFH08DRAFT_931866 [Mycena albidolilacea]|uniref:F-box domain-containing protein n=1 Tax=Mycena albidolilacea TaxID=1033008 RepID=A0AAD7AIU4_9AGAR|nr:hypothetical protein DFH08DRAFT_931866 [Mycena albidolilacea]
MESRFSHRFNTNYVPSDEEIECIQTDLVSHTQELARIDERIRELSAQRDQIQAYIGSHKALISHPRRLPVDILREIFVACLPANRNAVMSAREAPLLLGRICSAWRAIALSTPKFWASLHAPLDYILEKEPRKLAVIEWLQRSGAAPISLSVCPERESRNSSESSLSAWSEGLSLFKSLAESATRWCHLDLLNFLDGPGWEDQLAEISTPALESLKFSGSVSLLRNLDIAKVPRLRAIALHSNDPDEHIDEFILEMRLGWSRLTHLSLVCYRHGQHSGISLRNIIVLLGRCPQLISFQVSLSEADIVTPSQLSGLILLPHLQTFIMTKSSLGAQSLGYLIDHVSMPQLRRFCVEELRGPISLSVAALGTGSPLLQELGSLDLPSLQDDSLTDRWLPPEDLNWLIPHSLEGILHSFSSLTTLAVSSDVGYGPDPHLNKFLHLLTPGDNLETVPCPALQELVIKYCSDLERSALNTFIRGRIRLAQGFRRLEIQNSQVPDLISKTENEFYCSQGVDISIDYGAFVGLKLVLFPWMGLSPDAIELQ